MKKHLLMLVAAVLIISSFSTVSHSAADIQPGDIVYAEWVTNGWYHGTVGDMCEEGSYMIYFDDGDTKCCNTAAIVKDVIPPKTSVLPGKSVLAQWSDGKYYPGKVTVINGDIFNISFDDGDKGQVRLDQIRLRN